jgi:uncharacterized protein (TIGR03435 family)
MFFVAPPTINNRTLSILSLIGLSTLSVSAQRMADLPRFEVASVKPSRPIAGQGVFFGVVSDPGRFRGSFVTLTDFVGKAYGVDVARISGGPAWVSTERYDVVATLPTNASQGQIPILLQTLLADRFGLTVRRDTKMSQVYALVPAKGGPKLKRSEAATSISSNGPATIFSAPGIVSANGGGIRLCCGKAKLVGISMARLADLLSSQTDRPVQDNTGIQGLFDVSLDWTPEEVRPQPEGAASPAGASIYSAIQEQLGLRLEPRTAPSEYLAIEHATRPTDN